MISTKKIFAFLVAPLFVLIPASVFAATPTAPSATSTQLNVQVIADVALRDCTYVQATSADQSIAILCTIINKLGNQGDIHYGVQLVKRTKTSQEVVALKAYSEVLSLRENQTVQQKIDYTPPVYLSGAYELWGILKTSDGLPLASNLIGTVTLKASTASYLEIKRSTCSLTVGTTTYSFNQRAAINLGQSLEGTCDVVSHSTGDVTVTPAFVTYQGSVFGEVVSGTGDAQQAVAFKNNETKTVSFVLPKVATPQSYVAMLSLTPSSGTVISNEVFIQYMVRGASAAIQNVALDKDYYAAGDTAQVSIFWTGPAANIVLSMKDGSDTLCAKETVFATDTGGLVTLKSYPLPVMRFCANPQVTVKMTDAAGVVLAEKTVAFATGQVPESALAHFLKQPVVEYSAAALVIIILGAVLFIKNRKQQYENY